MRKLFITTLLVIVPHVALAVTPVTSNGVNGSGGFPVALTTAGETYQLTESIVCDTTCFTVKAANITIDLNGHTATFGNWYNPNLTDPSFESWSDANTPAYWTAASGTITRQSSTFWGSYHASLSAAASVKSSLITLKAGQSYIYYAIMGGSSGDSYTISVKNAADNTTLASTSIPGGLLNRAFGAADGIIRTQENTYKPVSDTTVYLQIDCSGSTGKILYYADIKPQKHFFVTWNNYRNANLYPDLPDSLFGGTSSGLIIKNGTISQGLGQGLKSAATYGVSLKSLDHVNISMSGNNTSAVHFNGETTTLVDVVQVNTASILNLNRMHPPGGIDFSTGATGSVEMRNSTLLNDPEMSIRYYRSDMRATDTVTVNIHDNVIRGKEQVTEGYAIAMSGVRGVTIQNNDINPIYGRGILLDAVANNSSTLDGTKDVTIRNNTIRNIYERSNPEYGATGLEAAGIRIRNWGDSYEGHRNLKIYGNSISVYTDATGTHRSYGINATVSGASDDIEIYDNTITATLNSSGGADWAATAVAFQGVDMTRGGSLRLHNNVITGNSEGVRFGGNDGSQVKGLYVYDNQITAKDAVYWYGYQGPFTENHIYCNQIVGTGYPFNFEPGAPVFTNNYISNNQITASPTYEASVTTNLATGTFFCGNGTIDITGGGQVGSVSPPCQDGITGCYATAGLSTGDTSAPITTIAPSPVAAYTTTQTVTLSCVDNVGCAATLYCIGAACTPVTPYPLGGLQLSASTIIRYRSSDGVNVENTKEASYTINISAGGDTTPPTTTATPGGGPYTGTQSVVLSCTDTSGCEGVYFTTNGDTPVYPASGTTTQYTLPIVVPSSRTIKWIARDTSGNTSAVQSAAYTISATLPFGFGRINASMTASFH